MSIWLFIRMYAATPAGVAPSRSRQPNQRWIQCDYVRDWRTHPRNADNTNRVRSRIRSDRQRLGGELCTSGRQCYRLLTNEPVVGSKWLGLLKEIAPRIVRVALLFNPATAASPQFFRSSIQDAASPMAVQVIDAPFHSKDEIEGIVAAQARNPDGGFIVMPDAFFFSVPNRNLVVALVARYGVPTIYWERFFVEEGGLISYGDDFAEEMRQAAGYIDRILKGAKPADLPIQSPINYEMAINLKTATSLGLNVSPTLLARADRVIE